MKIVYLANSRSIHTQRWARHFVGYGHEVTVVSFAPDEIEGVRVIHLPIKFGRRVGILFNLGKVRRLVQELNPDVVHAHYVTSYGLAGALSRRHPLVVTAWGSDVLITPEHSWIYRQVVRLALGRADLITSMADHMTQLLVDRGYAPASKILTLPFGVDTETFNPRRRETRNKNGAPVIVSTRRLDVGLDVDVFVRAIPRVIEAYPNAEFLVIGDGPLRAEIVELARRLDIAERIEFRGEIQHAQMAAALTAADIFVSTSTSDGNNISLNESMACGAFPIVTDIPANRSWITDGENGLLFPCGDERALATAMIDALEKPEWREAAMHQNWEIVRTRGSWTNSMATMAEHYKALVGRN